MSKSAVENDWAEYSGSAYATVGASCCAANTHSRFNSMKLRKTTIRTLCYFSNNIVLTRICDFISCLLLLLVCRYCCFASYSCLSHLISIFLFASFCVLFGFKLYQGLSRKQWTVTAKTTNDDNTMLTNEYTMETSGRVRERVFDGALFLSFFGLLHTNSNTRHPHLLCALCISCHY